MCNPRGKARREVQTAYPKETFIRGIGPGVNKCSEYKAECRREKEQKSAEYSPETEQPAGDTLNEMCEGACRDHLAIDQISKLQPCKQVQIKHKTKEAKAVQGNSNSTGKAVYHILGAEES